MEEGILYRLKANCPYLKVVDVSHQNLDISKVKVLTHFLEKNTHVTIFNLEGNIITNEGALLIRDMLKHNTYLKELNLINTKISEEGRRAICKIINKRKYLKISFIKNFIVTGCYNKTIFHMIKH